MMQSKTIKRIKNRENLPLLRGMFIYPAQGKRKKQELMRFTFNPVGSDDGLVLSPDQGIYLGE